MSSPPNQHYQTSGPAEPGFAAQFGSQKLLLGFERIQGNLIILSVSESLISPANAVNQKFDDISFLQRGDNFG